MAVVKDLAVSLIQDVEASKDVAATRTMSLDEFRAWLIDGNARYAEFFQKLPRLFRMLVSSRSTPVNIAHIMKLIELARHQENSDKSLTEKQAEAGHYLRGNFMREARPGEADEAVRNGTGVRGTPVTRDQVRDELSGKKSIE